MVYNMSSMSKRAIGDSWLTDANVEYLTSNDAFHSVPTRKMEDNVRATVHSAQVAWTELIELRGEEKSLLVVRGTPPADLESFDPLK